MQARTLKVTRVRTQPAAREVRHWLTPNLAGIKILEKDALGG
jgi:hypothetical protein